MIDFTDTQNPQQMNPADDDQSCGISTACGTADSFTTLGASANRPTLYRQQQQKPFLVTPKLIMIHP